jgi:hypothetical protein
MGVRPNITSITLEGAVLKVRGESDEPLPTVVHVVVTQRDPSGPDRAVEVARGQPDRASTGWGASLPAQGFKTGAAEALGVEIRVDPFEVTSWVQSVSIR